MQSVYSGALEQYAARATSLASGIRIIESGERRERERVSCQEIGAISENGQECG